jgi:hypothetical protein
LRAGRKKVLLNNQKTILFIELAGLLHDIGKLSQKFLDYRRKWQDDPEGWDKDPHEHNYLDEHEVFKNLIPPQFEKKIKSLGGENFGEPNFSIKKAVHSHTDPKGDIGRMLKAADSVDSAIDRNNPLWCTEQKDRVFMANVFGYEMGRVVTPESQEAARENLYLSLQSKLPGYLKDFEYEQREEVLASIKQAFQEGLSDTNRPQNDTTLWDHSYAVASILKVIAVHNLFAEKKILKFEDVVFGILGIGWDGLRFISYGQKIGDIVGRKAVLEKIKQSLKKLIEYEYPVGNEIYSDDDGIYFIVPPDFKKNLSEIWGNVESEIFKIAADASKGELQPCVKLEQKTFTLTSIVKVIREIKEESFYRFDSSRSELNQFLEKAGLKLKEGEESSRKLVCPICRLRLFEPDKPDICDECLERRKEASKARVQGRKKAFPERAEETVFLDEIIDKNRRAALIVARFNLEEWLSGRMVRTLFVKEAKDLEREVENLDSVKSFEKKSREIKRFLKKKESIYGKFSYDRIREDIDSVMEPTNDFERARRVACLYGRKIPLLKDKGDLEEEVERWKKFEKEAKNETPGTDIYNLLVAKTPTPSTLLDAWLTTLDFSGVIPVKLREIFSEKRRLELVLRFPNADLREYVEWKGTLEARVSEKPVELLFKGIKEGKLIVEVVGETLDSLEEWKGQEVRITDRTVPRLRNRHFIVEDCRKGEAFLPFRTITVTPNIFMTIVPADRAIEVTTMIYQDYVEKFGKVMGRLPFSVGNIFFGRNVPMFVVLDAAKRMVFNFEELSKSENGKPPLTLEVGSARPSTKCDFTIKCQIGGFAKTIKWRLPYGLGNCDVDYHHPYFIIESGSKNDSPEKRSTFFKTPAGDVVHFSEIKKGDRIAVFPNYYDFEFLDSNARRYDLVLDSDKRRRSSAAEFKSKPFLLDELEQKVNHLWKDLIQGKQLEGITDAKLRNLQSLWLSKYQEWRVDLSNKGSDKFKMWEKLFSDSISKEFPELGEEQRNFLKEVLEDGLLFDTLEIYLSVLKERVEER